MRSCLGIEMGHYRIKIAYVERGKLREFISEQIRGVDYSDLRQYADLIKDLLKDSSIRCKKVVFVIPQEQTYVKRFNLPRMTEEQLRLNLPYEFHDYIGNDIDQYVFDYALLEMKEDSMDLLAAACSKEVQQRFLKLARWANLKLVGLVPSVVGLERLLELAEAKQPVTVNKEKPETEKKSENEKAYRDYAILDLGTKANQIHFYRRGCYDITRTLEPGCEEIERLYTGERDKMRELGIEADASSRDEEEQRRLSQYLENELQDRAIQIMRVLNFYSFNNSDNTIDSLYYCGGGARYQELIDTLKNVLGLPVRSMAELLPEIAADGGEGWIDSPQTFGVLIE